MRADESTSATALTLTIAAYPVTRAARNRDMYIAGRSVTACEQQQQQQQHEHIRTAAGGEHEVVRVVAAAS